MCEVKCAYAVFVCVISRGTPVSKHIDHFRSNEAETNWSKVLFHFFWLSLSIFLLAEHLGPEAYWGAHLQCGGLGGIQHDPLSVKYQSPYLTFLSHRRPHMYPLPTHSLESKVFFISAAKLIFQIWNDTRFSGRYIFKAYRSKLSGRLCVFTVLYSTGKLSMQVFKFQIRSFLK